MNIWDAKGDCFHPRALCILHLKGDVLTRLDVWCFAQIGKDRTGLIVALILAACGATDDEIVSDYARSDSPDGIALGGLEKMKELEGVSASCPQLLAKCIPLPCMCLRQTCKCRHWPAALPRIGPQAVRVGTAQRHGDRAGVLEVRLVCSMLVAPAVPIAMRTLADLLSSVTGQTTAARLSTCSTLVSTKGSRSG